MKRKDWALLRAEKQRQIYICLNKEYYCSDYTKYSKKEGQHF